MLFLQLAEGILPQINQTQMLFLIFLHLIKVKGSHPISLVLWSRSIDGKHWNAYDILINGVNFLLTQDVFHTQSLTESRGTIYSTPFLLWKPVC